MIIDAMNLARRKYVETLPLARPYRVGKYAQTGIGHSDGGLHQRVTLLELAGPGLLTRLWTTHEGGNQVKLHFFIDGEAEPVLSGLARELAEAAARISTPEIPLGGLHEGLSICLFLPLYFRKSLRIECEPVGPTGDGPYWQIDYAMGNVEPFPLPQQYVTSGKIEIRYDSPDNLAPALPASAAASRQLEMLDQTVELRVTGTTRFLIDGPAIIRKITLTGANLDRIILRMNFDQPAPPPAPEGRLDAPFQVDAPLRYLVGQFNNAAVERRGSQMIIHFPMPFRTRAGIQLYAGIEEGDWFDKPAIYPVRLQVEYERNPPGIEKLYYFHAIYRQGSPDGYDDFECCSLRGQGHFVGLHLFDSGHDHGGGDNVMFDAGAASAGQLHGICGEDYFHMAYMRTGVLTPYAGCVTHSARYRHHLELPIPFRESLVFNWGSFAGQPIKAVAIWYQSQPATNHTGRELTYHLTGPFPLDQIDTIKPGAQLPVLAEVNPGREAPHPRMEWLKTAQQGFVDLCHVHRKCAVAYPPSYGALADQICTLARTSIWSARETRAVLKLGCDDPIRLYLGDQLIFRDDGRLTPDPFKQFDVPVMLKAGLNEIAVVVGNVRCTPGEGQPGNRFGANWGWNGFSLVVRSDLKDDELRYVY